MDLTATAVSTLAVYARTYLCSDSPAALQKLLTRYCSALKEVNPAVRRAYALALGAMPAQLLSAASGQVLQSLATATELEAEVELRDAETRKNAGIFHEQTFVVPDLIWLCFAVHAIGQVLRTLGNAAVASEDGRRAVFAVLAALEDHTTDERHVVACFAVISPRACVLLCLTSPRRGDVGSWVREAALEELTELSRMWNSTPDLPWMRQVCEHLACGATRAALERLDKIRFAAVKCLVRHHDEGYFCRR